MDAVAPDWCGRFVKIPYLDKGRTRAGLDCYGLFALVNREQFGRVVPDYVYPSSLDQGAVAQVMGRYLDVDFRRVETPVPGDLITLKILGRPWHCGIWVAPGLMLHAIDHTVSGIDRLDSVRWARRVTGFHRPCNAGDVAVAA